VGPSQEGKEINQSNFVSPAISYLSKKKPEASPPVSETIKGSLHTEVQFLE
jgi:hypothetical protein